MSAQPMPRAEMATAASEPPILLETGSAGPRTGAEPGPAAGRPGPGAVAPDPQPSMLSRIAITPATGYALIALAAVAGLVVLFAGTSPGLAGLALLVALTLTGAGFTYAAAQPAQSGLGRREKLKSLVLDHLQDPVAVTDRSGLIVYANAAYLATFRTPDGLVQPPDTILGGVSDTAARLFRLMRAAAEGGSLALPMTAGPAAPDAASGQSYSVAVSPLRGARGLALWRITSRSEAMAGLPAVLPEAPGATKLPGAEDEGPMASDASSRDPVPPHDAAGPGLALPQVLVTAPIGIAFVTADDRVHVVNPAFADLTGGAAGAALADLVISSDRNELLALVAAAREGRSGGPLEVRLAANPKGSAQALAAPLPPAEDGSVRAVLYLSDTSEQKSIEIQFAQSQKMQAVGQLAGGIAHDFNNLLTVVLGFTELLLQRHKPGDPSFADLMQIKNNAARAARLVAQLLAFSRRQVLQSKVFFVDELLNELSDMLRRVLTERVTLLTRFGSEVWPIRVDEGQFSNMIMNLALNAKDAMPEGGTVTLNTTNVTLAEPLRTDLFEVPAGDYVLIEVADTGVGIPKEIRGQIFEPFFTTKGQGKGTGLGLSMVYGFVKQSGGFIFTDSEIGQGTTFRIYLPRYMGTEQSVAVTEDAERAQPRDLTGRGTILLVEDEDAVRSFAARALSMRGYTVLEANGAEAALALAHQHLAQIRLLITDVVMPNMDGPALAKEIRQMRPDLSVIFISGYAEDAFRRAHENPESLHFLPKPFSLKQLAAKVKDVLDGA